jgi:putative pyruvate formate lyase activating enzyme
MPNHPSFDPKRSFHNENHFDLYKNCSLCPRLCGKGEGIDREHGSPGFCGESAAIRVASASVHRGEEPPISGVGGSGTIFISGCNLRCVFCQNYQISQEGMGKEVSEEEFADICGHLQKCGAENINIVTGSHCVPGIVSAIKRAKSKGLSIPVLWNSSAYETINTLSLLGDVVDIYLPDLKTLSPKLAKHFFNAEDYPFYASRAIKKMMSLKPHKIIIRHLVLPDHLESTREVLEWFSKNARGRAELSLMTQYTPVYRNGHEYRHADGRTFSLPQEYGCPQRYMNKNEYETVLRWLDEFEIEDGYYQELETGSDWLPDFNKTNPFSSSLSVPVWHWRTGFL